MWDSLVDGKVSACNVGDPDLIPGSGRSPGIRNGADCYKHFTQTDWSLQQVYKMGTNIIPILYVVYIYNKIPELKKKQDSKRPGNSPKVTQD